MRENVDAPGTARDKIAHMCGAAGSAVGRRVGLSTSNERGSGAVLVVAMLGAIVMVTVTLIPLSGAFIASQNAANAADSAALAAADVASGLLPGIACERAASVSTANGATLNSCSVEGAIAQVGVTLSWSALGIALQASGHARAGPPGSP